MFEVEARRARGGDHHGLGHFSCIRLERAELRHLELGKLHAIGEGELLHSSRTVLGLGGAGGELTLGARSLCKFAVPSC